MCMEWGGESLEDESEPVGGRHGGCNEGTERNYERVEEG